MSRSSSNRKQVKFIEKFSCIQKFRLHNKLLSHVIEGAVFQRKHESRGFCSAKKQEPGCYSAKNYSAYRRDKLMASVGASRPPTNIFKICKKVCQKRAMEQVGHIIFCGCFP